MTDSIPQNPFHQAVALMAAMSHDELRDLIDYTEFHYVAKWISRPPDAGGFWINPLQKLARSRRAGLGAGFPDAMLQPNAARLNMTTKAQRDAIAIIKALPYEYHLLLFGELPPVRSTRGAVAWELLKLKAPLRLQSAGNIQVKHIPYERVRKEYNEDGVLVPVLDENNNLIIDTLHGRYLYLRYWQAGGSDGVGSKSRRQKRRMKSIYIGGDGSADEYPYRALADLLYEAIQMHGIAVTRTGKDGQQQTYKRRPSGDDNPIAALERRIMGCIDLGKVDAIGSDAIDHKALEALQSEVC